MKKNTEKTFCVKCTRVNGRTMTIACYLELGNTEYLLASEIWEEELRGTGYRSHTPTIKTFAEICSDDDWFICDMLDALKEKGEGGSVRIGGTGDVL